MDMIAIGAAVLSGAYFTYMVCESSKKHALEKQRKEYESNRAEQVKNSRLYMLFYGDTQRHIELTYRKLRRIEDLREMDLPDDNRIPEYRELISLEEWLGDYDQTNKN